MMGSFVEIMPPLIAGSMPDEGDGKKRARNRPERGRRLAQPKPRREPLQRSRTGAAGHRPRKRPER